MIEKYIANIYLSRVIPLLIYDNINYLKDMIYHTLMIIPKKKKNSKI